MGVAEALGLIDGGEQGGGTDRADEGDGAQMRHARILAGEVHANQSSLIEYSLAAPTHMSRTPFVYLGDPPWPKRRMAEALEW